MPHNQGHAKKENVTPIPPKINLLSYTTDFQTDEIVMICLLNNGEYGELRVSEKDIQTMTNWMNLGKTLRNR